MSVSTSTRVKTDKRKKVLHLAGSTKNEFYFDLGCTYMRQCDACPNLDRETFEFLFAVVHVDATWSFPSSTEKSAISEATRYSEKDALQKILELEIDVMVPHMFCMVGVTYYRSLFDKMNIPFVGNKEETILLAVDKGVTKETLFNGGVQVPKGEVLTKGKNEVPKEDFVYPCIVKPCNEDNSFGLSLVKKEEDLPKAIEFAFKYSDRILIDEYIAGREIRVAVTEEKDGSLTASPKLEYFVDEIRTTAVKYAIIDGKLSDNPQADIKKDGDRQCPATLSPDLEQRINEQAMKAHKVMKCTHYSLWDMRVDEHEQPFILEACLFCSFSPLSVIPSMTDNAGRDDLIHPGLFHMFLDKAACQ